MKRKIALLAVCVLLVFQMAAPPAEAVRTVYFVAADKSVLSVTDETMPFWHNGFLYISSSIFTGMTRESLGISHVINAEQKVTILYGDNKALWFEQGLVYGNDSDGNTYYPGVVVRNGHYFVPAAVVAKYFNLQYSVIDVPLGYLVWLRKPGSVLTESLFADAATGPMNNRYQDYLKSQSQTEQPGTTQPGGSVLPPEDVPGERVYLCLEAGENTKTLLDALDTYRMKATFFCGPDFLQEQDDLLRRMLVSGHGIGLLADATDAEQTVEVQLQSGNRALARATFGKSRLALVKNGTDEVWQATREAGYCCLIPEEDRSGRELKSAANATALLQRLHERGGSETVWLADTVSASGLRAFLHILQNEEGQCLVWRETV